jgi:hypothetical protein
MSIILDGTSGITTPGETNTGNLSVTGTTTLTTVLPVASGGSGSTSLTANSVLLGNGTAAISANLVAPGTTGNLLTSNGTTWTSAAAPSSAPTTAQVLSATAGATAGAVGTYILAGASALSISANSTIAGSSLTDGGVHGDGTSINSSVPQLAGAALSGTWRAMGSHSPTGAYNGVTLFLRTA